MTEPDENTLEASCISCEPGRKVSVLNGVRQVEVTPEWLSDKLGSPAEQIAEAMAAAEMLGVFNDTPAERVRPRLDDSPPSALPGTARADTTGPRPRAFGPVDQRRTQPLDMRTVARRQPPAPGRNFTLAETDAAEVLGLRLPRASNNFTLYQTDARDVLPGGLTLQIDTGGDQDEGSKATVISCPGSLVVEGATATTRVWAIIVAGDSPTRAGVRAIVQLLKDTYEDEAGLVADEAQEMAEEQLKADAVLVVDGSGRDTIGAIEKQARSKVADHECETPCVRTVSILNLEYVDHRILSKQIKTYAGPKKTTIKQHKDEETGEEYETEVVMYPFWVYLDAAVDWKFDIAIKCDLPEEDEKEE